MSQNAPFALRKKKLFILSECDHTVCVECLGSHLENHIVAAELPIACPQIGCGKDISENDIEKLVSEELFKKFQIFWLKLRVPELRECPKCSHMCKPEPDSDSVIVKCPSCKTQFCMVHSNAHPVNVTCRAYEKVLKKAGGEKTAKLIKGLKKCPTCGVSTERVTGCPMMTCANCQTHWCYACGGKCVGTDEFTFRCTTCGANAFGENDPTCLSCCCASLCFPCWFTCGILYSICICPCACCCGKNIYDWYMYECFWLEMACHWFWCPWMLCCPTDEQRWERRNEKSWNKELKEEQRAQGDETKESKKKKNKEI